MELRMKYYRRDDKCIYCEKNIEGDETCIFLCGIRDSQMQKNGLVCEICMKKLVTESGNYRTLRRKLGLAFGWKIHVSCDGVDCCPSHEYGQCGKTNCENLQVVGENVECSEGQGECTHLPSKSDADEEKDVLTKMRQDVWYFTDKHLRTSPQLVLFKFIKLENSCMKCSYFMDLELFELYLEKKSPELAKRIKGRQLESYKCYGSATCIAATLPLPILAEIREDLERSLGAIEEQQEPPKDRSGMILPSETDSAEVVNANYEKQVLIQMVDEVRSLVKKYLGTRIWYEKMVYLCMKCGYFIDKDSLCRYMKKKGQTELREKFEGQTLEFYKCYQPGECIAASLPPEMKRRIVNELTGVAPEATVTLHPEGDDD